LLRGPGLDERAVHREMLVRQQGLDLWVIQKGSGRGPCAGRCHRLGSPCTSVRGSSEPQTVCLAGAGGFELSNPETRTRPFG
jgi:hypothetical protein